MDISKDKLNVIVTGATGLVGSNLVKHLQNLNHNLNIIITGSEREQSVGIKPIAHKLKEINFQLDLPSKIDVVFHQGAISDSYCKDEKALTEANVDEPMELFTKLFLQKKCRRFVYASSTAVYGHEQAPYVEGVTELKPANPYGMSKRTFEGHMKKFVRASDDLVVIGLRYCSLYGPGEKHKEHMASMIYKMAQLRKEGKQVKLFKFGEQKRDYLYVKDVARANVLAAQAEESGVYNCGFGGAIDFNTIAKTLDEVLSRNKIIKETREPEYIDNPNPETYQNFIECDMNLIKEKLGFEPTFSLEQGIQDYLDSGYLLL